MDPPRTPSPIRKNSDQTGAFAHQIGRETGPLLIVLERWCQRSGATVTWSGREWVRFEGPRHSLRVFPGPSFVDLQLVGADEGTLTGLKYRHGVLKRMDPPLDAPPEVHIRLKGGEDLSPGLSFLLASWLRGSGGGNEDFDPRPRSAHPR